jgi:hypothetical protein
MYLDHKERKSHVFTPDVRWWNIDLLAGNVHTV